MDLDGFVDSQVTTAADYEGNFRAVKARRREADKLPEMVKVCLVLLRIWSESYEGNIFIMSWIDLLTRRGKRCLDGPI